MMKKKLKLLLEDIRMLRPEKKHNVEPIYFHVILNQGKTFECEVPIGHNSFIYILTGELEVGKKS